MGNVNHGTSLARNFFRSKVGIDHRFQYGSFRRSLSQCASAAKRLIDFDKYACVKCHTETSHRNFQQLL